MLYLDHKKSHNHNPLSFNKILNPKEKQSQEYAPYRLIRGFSFWEKLWNFHAILIPDHRYFFIISQKSNAAK